MKIYCIKRGKKRTIYLIWITSRNNKNKIYIENIYYRIKFYAINKTKNEKKRGAS